ncbi:MAG: hypothetical protein SPG61_01610 [Arcanobacterium sp.]|nr:hypothetical protein [Arcanobacterium sp.]
MKKSIVSALAIATLTLSTATACGNTASNGTSSTSENTGASTNSQSENSTSTSSETEKAEEPSSEDNRDAAATADDTSFTTAASRSDNWSNIDAQAKYQTHRIGTHAEYDRVVVEYQNEDNTKQLSWASEGWADEVVEDGRGLPYDLDSKRALQIIVGGLRYTEDGDPEIKDLSTPTGSALKKVIVSYPFEGYHLINIGRDSDAPYRVTLLENPTRIVIDIQK